MSLRGGQPRRPVLRGDYRPPVWLVDQVELDIRLDPDRSEVFARLALRRNPASQDRQAPLILNGVDLTTLAVAVDGESLSRRQYRIDGETMIIGRLPDRAELTTRVAIHPARNTALEGLYASGSSLLTQCEAEGFRKITWFPDRPDVMSVFRVRLEADRNRFPVLLSNGNLAEAGDLDDDRHYCLWVDPFPKPCYLFALVAGKLAAISDRFRTRSGREVDLKIYSEPDNLGRLDHAMASLKRAMAWDEERFGLEYDLDVYHIVATHDFNMGAMENKGLNIFNARYVLADQATATDADFEAVESVIAHEYFHNWTGNRVTCRDWFQLTLKEGLTVFRDQEFSADMGSPAVKRIHDVAMLMARQFPEDAGPMAHPVRPERYVEINNFYTATVYEKGAEVVRMLQTLLGRVGFRRGLDLYFQRHDGEAVTCDDFLTAMADANQRDLSQFGRWYRQVGTPRLAVEADYDQARAEFVLQFRQHLPEHGDNRELGPLMIPIQVGFLDRDNQPLAVIRANEPDTAATTRLLVLTQPEAEFRFRGLPPDALPSLLREFSAPVALEFPWSQADLARLAAHDPDPFNRWRAARRLAEQVLDEASAEAGAVPASAALLLEAWRSALGDAALDDGLVSELMSLPSEAELAQRQDRVDIEAIHHAHGGLIRFLVEALGDDISGRYRSLAERKAWSGDGLAVASRRLKNQLLQLLVVGDAKRGGPLAVAQFQAADNMTDRLTALRALVHTGHARSERALAAFERHFAADPLVMDKWFAVQATIPDPATVDRVEALMQHRAFSLRNPNKVRALLGSFSQHNPLAFHRPDGAGYRLLGAAIAELDGLNPQVAARLASAFNRWQVFDEARAAAMRATLETLARRKRTSPDLEEIVAAALRQRAA